MKAVSRYSSPLSLPCRASSHMRVVYSSMTNTVINLPFSPLTRAASSPAWIVDGRSSVASRATICWEPERERQHPDGDPFFISDGFPQPCPPNFIPPGPEGHDKHASHRDPSSSSSGLPVPEQGGYDCPCCCTSPRCRHVYPTHPFSLNMSGSNCQRICRANLTSRSRAVEACHFFFVLGSARVGERLCRGMTEGV